MRAAFSHNFYCSNAKHLCHTEIEVDNLISNSAEFYRLCLFANWRKKTVGFNGNRHRFDVFIHRKNRHWDIHFLGWSNHTRNSGQNHKWLFYWCGFFGRAIGNTLPRNNHRSNRTDIVWHCNFVHVFFTCCHFKWTDKPNHRLKSIRLGSAIFLGVFIAT